MRSISLRVTVAWLTLALVSSSLSACAAPRPVLAPNDHLRQVGKTAAQRDINQCIAQAKENGVRRQGSQEGLARDVAEDSASSAAGGAAAGAILGSRSVGRSAAAAGVFAGIRTFFSGLFRSNRPDPVYQIFVDRCLEQRGYEPLGWQ